MSCRITYNNAVLIDRYWTLDETVMDPRVDKVVGDLLLNASSNMDFDGVPGLYSNAVHIDNLNYAGGNAICRVASAPVFNTLMFPALATPGIGFSLAGWVKINAYNPGGLLDSDIMCVVADGPGSQVLMQLELYFGDNGPGTHFFYADKNLLSGILPFAAWATGTWVFFHIFYDGSQAGYSFNNGPEQTSGVALQCGATNAYYIEINAQGTPTAPAIAAYWTLDEALADVDRIDSVTGLPLFAGGPTMAGAPALISNGVEFDATFGGQGYSTFPVAQLAHPAGSGFSMWGWFKINALGPSGPNTGYTASIGHFIEIVIGDSTTPQSVQINTQTDSVDLNISLGSFHFFHLFWDDTSQKFGYSIDNGAETLLPTSVFLGGTATGVVALNKYGTSPSPGNVLWDEIGVVVSAKLNAAQVAYLYNSGAGRTWPIVLPASGTVNLTDYLVDELAFNGQRKFTPSEVAFLYNGGAGRTWPL